MARLFTSGFELNTTTAGVEWTSVGSSPPTIQSTTKRSGTYALQITSLSSLSSQKHLIYQYLSVEGSSNTYFRVYVRFDTLPTIEDAFVGFNDTTVSTSLLAYLTIDNSGVVKLYDEDGQITGTTTLSTTTWYCLEVHINTTPAAGSHVVEARVDQGSTFASSSTRNISSTNNQLAFVLGGNLTAENNSTGNWYFDDVAINDNSGSFQNSWPGPGEVIHLLPDGDGDNTAWTNTFTNIDEVTPNDGTDYIESNTLNQIEEVTLAATPASLDTTDVITTVQVYTRFTLSSAISTDPTFVTRIKSAPSGTVEESATISPTSTSWLSNAVALPRTPSLTLYDLPGASTTAWTKSDLDTAQIGVKETLTDGDTVRVSSLQLIIDHTPNTGGGGSTTVIIPKRMRMGMGA